MTAKTAIGWGQEGGMDEDTEMWKEGVRVRSFMEAQKGKKILFERLFSRNKKINALTEVKENQYLTASGIKFFQKQTAGNNCPVCMAELTQRSRFTPSWAYGSRLACQHFVVHVTVARSADS